MKTIEHTLLETRETRRRFLKLDEPCTIRGHIKNSAYLIGLLAHHLDTTIPVSGYKIHVCHACNNSQCCNPNHLYFGSPRDNTQDAIEAGGQRTVWERTVDKYGYEEACKMQSRGDKSAGGKAGKGKPKSEAHKQKIAESVRKSYQKKKAS